jgi:ring-1,2-phenylacetyl-CoA epoxidase subunit PaaE
VRRSRSIDWRTVALGLASIAVWIGAAVAFLAGYAPWWLTVPAQALAGAALMIVLHEAAHRNVSRTEWVNGAVGRAAMPFIAPYCSLPSFRFLHGQHHNHTNAGAARDPDDFVTDAPWWQLPMRWVLYDVAYVRWYLRQLGARPGREVAESTAVALAFDAAVVWCIVSGNLGGLVVAWLIPQRLSFCAIAWGFAWLPHHGLPPGRRAKTTRARLGMEWLLTPALFAQNFHLVHHLYPRVPFHSLLATWRRREREIRAMDPPLVGPLGGPSSRR